MAKRKMRDLSKKPEEQKYRSRHMRAELIVAGFATIAFFILIMWIVQLIIKSAPTNTL